MKLLFAKIYHYLNIESEVEDFEQIHQAIERGIIFKGTNLWILVFAIIVASVGLNINSTAVIIGAMLISPLMGPINGMGYSIATYNFPLFRKSLKNFGFAVLASLVASTTYFLISPVSTAHSELLARTSPTIYDVMIAFFGGTAGIIAISSKQKGNVIPGVAIATALMPPLCTAGFGLATMQFAYFFGALYLFAINTVFIAISSILISQMLKFPIRTIVDKSQQKKVNQWITAIILITIIPSIYFGFRLVQNEKFNENANKFIQSVSVFEGSILFKSDINPNKKSISLIYGGNTLNPSDKELIKSKLKIFEIQDADLEIQQGFSFNELAGSFSEIDKLKTEINQLKLQLQLKEKQQDSIRSRILIGREMLEEIKALYPQISSCTYAESIFFDVEIPDGVAYDLVAFEVRNPINDSIKNKIHQWSKARLKSNNLKVYYTLKPMQDKE